MDQTSNNQNESDEIKMSRGSVDANEGSLGSGKKKSRFGIGVLVGIVIGAVIITGVWVIWYWKNITITNEFKKDQSIQINFEGCDYHLDLWVNGVYKGSHDGAYTRFAFELGKFAEGEEVLLSIRVEDPHSEEQVRGKQRC